MEEFAQLGSAIKHGSFTPHRRFDQVADLGMLIDMNNIPNETRLAEPDYPNLPVYSVAPIEALRIRTFIENRNYLFEILIDEFNETPLPFTPTPYNENCTVCLLVQWLVERQPSYAEAVYCLCEQEEACVFEVACEIWSRLHPKPFKNLHYAVQCGREIITLYQLLRSHNEEIDQDQRNRFQNTLHSSFNLAVFGAHVDFISNQSTVLCQTTEHIVSFLLLTLRHAACTFPEFSEEDCTVPLAILKAKLINDIMRRILITLANKVGIAISGFFGFEGLDSTRIRARSIAESFHQILCYNTLDIFSPYLLPPDLLVHKDDCSQNRSEC